MLHKHVLLVNGTLTLLWAEGCFPTWAIGTCKKIFASSLGNEAGFFIGDDAGRANKLLEVSSVQGSVRSGEPQPGC